MKQFLTIDEVAKQLSVSKPTLHQWAYQKLIPTIRHGRNMGDKYLFDKDYVDSLVKPPDKLLTPLAVSKMFHVSNLTIRNWIEAGKMSHVISPSGLYRIRRSELGQTSTYRKITPYNKHKEPKRQWKWKLKATNGSILHVDKDVYEKFKNEEIRILQTQRAEYPYISGKGYLHNLIVSPNKTKKPKRISYFIDKDTFDLRRSNTREATYRLSDFNRRPFSKRVKYKGAQKNYDKWVSWCDGKYLGTFDTAKQAARAHDRYVKEILNKKHIVGRVLNFPKKKH